MKTYSYSNSYQYGIEIIDRKEFEFDFVNCNTCKIYKNGFLIGRYDFNENQFNPTDLWGGIPDPSFEKLTNRQQKLVLISANKYFYILYSRIYKNLLQSGAFFSPTTENLEKQLYYTNKLKKLKNNIKILMEV